MSIVLYHDHIAVCVSGEYKVCPDAARAKNFDSGVAASSRKIDASHDDDPYTQNNLDMCFTDQYGVFVTLSACIRYNYSRCVRVCVRVRVRVLELLTPYGSEGL